MKEGEGGRREGRKVVWCYIACIAVMPVFHPDILAKYSFRGGGVYIFKSQGGALTIQGRQMPPTPLIETLIATMYVCPEETDCPSHSLYQLMFRDPHTWLSPNVGWNYRDEGVGPGVGERLGGRQFVNWVD